MYVSFRFRLDSISYLFTSWTGFQLIITDATYRLCIKWMLDVWTVGSRFTKSTFLICYGIPRRHILNIFFLVAPLSQNYFHKTTKRIYKFQVDRGNIFQEVVPQWPGLYIKFIYFCKGTVFLPIFIVAIFTMRTVQLYYVDSSAGTEDVKSLIAWDSIGRQLKNVNSCQ